MNSIETAVKLFWRGESANYTKDQLSLIAQVPKYAYLRAAVGMHDSLAVRWPEAEPYIMKDPHYAMAYAAHVIEGRWPEAEQYIMKDPLWAYEYAVYVISDDRWPEAEPYIMKDPCCASAYAMHIMTRRWLEAEPYMMQKETCWIEYCEHFGITRND